MKLAYKSICPHDQITTDGIGPVIACTKEPLLVTYDKITKGKLISNIGQTGTLQRRTKNF